MSTKIQKSTARTSAKIQQDNSDVLATTVPIKAPPEKMRKDRTCEDHREWAITPWPDHTEFSCLVLEVQEPIVPDAAGECFAKIKGPATMYGAGSLRSAVDVALDMLCDETGENPLVLPIIAPDDQADVSNLKQYQREACLMLTAYQRGWEAAESARKYAKQQRMAAKSTRRKAKATA